MKLVFVASLLSIQHKGEEQRLLVCLAQNQDIVTVERNVYQQTVVSVS
jgi:hypothetical protein